MISKMSLRRYFREIRSCLPCATKMKRTIISEIAESVSTYLTEDPNAGYDSIVARFGTPQQIAATYVEELDMPHLVNELRIKRKILRVVFIAAIVVLTLWAGVVTVALIDSYVDHGGTYERIVTEDEINTSSEDDAK